MSFAPESSNMSNFQPITADQINLEESTIQLFSQYCHIDDENHIKHKVASIYNQAMGVFPYRCIREFRFLLPRMSSHPFYPELVQHMASQNWKILDIGCCFGTDLRKLMVDTHFNVPVGNFKGIDVSDEFIRLGMELFEDQDKMTGNFFVGDILADEKDNAEQHELPSIFEPFRHSFNAIYAGSVIHLMDEPEIIKFVSRLIHLLAPGGVFFGRHVGAREQSGYFDRHRPESHDSGSTSTDAPVPEQGADQPPEKQRNPERQLRFLMTPESLHTVFEQAGFVDVSVTSTSSDMPMRANEGRRVGFVNFFARRPSH
eukprot:TRINITY_DN12828_c0_g2_i1.p1 TRINITY_DN12828_c0_g2~~TRINITY_DN12828_c0_g2_i1.p1  ORF type:complete len:315 (+),score=45.89 TRINITY_DN12828_c0_g2_i1:66-1010(+)